MYPLEEGMATRPTVFAQRIPWTEEPDGLQFMGHKESDMTEWLNTYIRILFFRFFSIIGYYNILPILSIRFSLLIHFIYSNLCLLIPNS